MRFSSGAAIYLHMYTGRLLTALAVMAVNGWAQSTAAVAGPVTGFIFDSQAAAMRPMLGIPGAAYLGKAMATGLNAASVAPDGSAALAVAADGKLVLYTGLRSAIPQALAVPGAIANPDHFAWATNAAAVYSSSSGQGQILTSLATSPSAAAPVDLSSLPGQVAAMAFDGQNLVLAVASGGIYMASAAGVQRIAAAAHPAALVLSGASLFFADSQSQQIQQVQNYAATPATVPFANDNSIDSPAGLQISADGKRLFAANAGNRKLAVYDIGSRSLVQTVDLSFTPTRLDRFGDTSVFLMNGSGQGPVYVARDGGEGKAAVYFVPAPRGHKPPKAPIRPN